MFRRHPVAFTFAVGTAAIIVNGAQFLHFVNVFAPLGAIIGVSLVAIAGSSYGAKALVTRRKRREGLGGRRVLIVGTPGEAGPYLASLNGGLHRITIVGHLYSGREGLRLDDRPLVPRITAPGELLDDLVVDEVVITGSGAPLDCEMLARACAARGIVFRKVVQMPEFAKPRYTAVPLSRGQCLLSLETVPRQSEFLAIKRAMDIVGSIPGLLACLIVFAVCGRRIKRETGGSVIFKQKRVGRNGRTFTLYKFRTMFADAESRLDELRARNEMNGHVFKIREDPRVTPLGRVLRRHHLDELPQFWNVLRGEMSLVGTRPPTCAEVAEYQPHHRRRLSMKPGLTGQWQLLGNGKLSEFERIVQLDCAYIDNWSLAADVRIILKTLVILLTGNGC
jgi:exopolysaccharide biosynthesis polyprenyl glycosylphosphotransferase